MRSAHVLEALRLLPAYALDICALPQRLDQSRVCVLPPSCPPAQLTLDEDARLLPGDIHRPRVNVHAALLHHGAQLPGQLFAVRDNAQRSSSALRQIAFDHIEAPQREQREQQSDCPQQDLSGAEQRPSIVTIHSVAAVVRPITISPFRRMAPAPMNPMPERMPSGSRMRSRAENELEFLPAVPSMPFAGIIESEVA
jgi:hypothetical protein